MKQSIAASAAMACLLAFGTAAYADGTSDALAKLRAIGQQEQGRIETDLSPLVPSGTADGTGEVIPAESEISAEWTDSPQEVLAEWKAAAVADPTALSCYKLGIAEKESGDLSGSAAALERAVALAPDQRQLYQSLEEVYDAQGLHKIVVFVDGKKIAFPDTDPVNQKGVTLLPIRSVVEPMGANVAWDNSTRTATVRLLDKLVVIPQDSIQASVNGQSRTLEAPAQNINGRVLVPLRFVAESFGAHVDYVSGTSDSYLIPITTN